MPSPMPAKEWIVVPPIAQAAIPVEAVTTTPSFDRPCKLLRAVIMWRKSTDFPVPAEPVKKTD